MDICNYNETIRRIAALKEYRIKTTCRYSTGYIDVKGEGQNSVEKALNKEISRS